MLEYRLWTRRLVDGICQPKGDQTKDSVANVAAHCCVVRTSWFAIAKLRHKTQIVPSLRSIESAHVASSELRHYALQTI